MIRTLTLRTLLLIVLIAILAFASGFLVPLRVIAASVLPDAGSSSTSSNVTSSSIAFGGVERTYRLFRPASLGQSVPVPLVVMLHGGFGTGLQAERAYGWDEAATRSGLVVVYPDGLSRAWNAGECCAPPQRNNVDDVGFLSALIERVARDENIDRSRIYITGMSNGALMAYRMACEAPLAIAAIGPVSGTVEVGCENAKPTSVLAIHGLADEHIPFQGGTPSKGVERSMSWRPVPDSIAQWRAIDGCSAASSRSDGAVTTSRALCAQGRAVELITVAGAGHQWPGSVPRQATPGAFLQPDPPSTALDATATLWTFFAAHRS